LQDEPSNDERAQSNSSSEEAAPAAKPLSQPHRTVGGDVFSKQQHKANSKRQLQDDGGSSDDEEDERKVNISMLARLYSPAANTPLLAGGLQAQQQAPGGTE
jgi:hypothetical protein